MTVEPLENASSSEDAPSPNEQYESTLDEIFGTKVYAPEGRRRLKFLPWHKPRKQYVREMQWCEQIRHMLQETLPDNNVLKYLGLPGDDLLDLRYFHEQICIPNNLQLKYLGFNNGINKEELRAEINISIDEVNRLQFVDPSSLVIADDICDIAKSDSIAWEQARKMGPFDVINIDLCDGFGKHPPDKFIETHYNTITKILTLQSRRLKPWLLLLTTRTGFSHVHEAVYTQLHHLYKANLENCPTFQELSAELLKISSEETLDEIAKTAKGVSDVFLISLCKWIAHYLSQQRPPARLEVKSVIGYKVYPQAEHQDLVSLAIKVEPTLSVEEDKIGLARNVGGDLLPDECQIAAQSLQSVYSQVDADEVLATNDQLMQQMIDVSSKLLEVARYDVSEYPNWARQVSSAAKRNL